MSPDPLAPPPIPLRESATMRAAVLAAPGRLELVDAPAPRPGPGQLRVRLEGSGVCGSDIPLWEGREWFEYPREPGAPGHEGWGVVEELGADVAGPPPGTRVATLGQRAYAELDVVAAAAVVELPPVLDGAAVPGEPLGCAVNVVRRAAIAAGETVAVVGSGFLGLLVVQLAAARGARVVAISRRETALDAARQAGAERTLPIDDDPVAAIEELTGGELCQCVVEATGRQEPLDLAAALTATRGRLVIAGYHQDGPRTVDMQLWNWRGLDVVNAHERDPAAYVDGMREAVRLLATGGLDVASLLTHSFPLERLDDAFTAAAERPPGFLKAVVAP